MASLKLDLKSETSGVPMEFQGEKHLKVISFSRSEEDSCVLKNFSVAELEVEDNQDEEGLIRGRDTQKRITGLAQGGAEKEGKEPIMKLLVSMLNK